MTVANLTHVCPTCPTCGAEESLDCLIGRMVDDTEVRHLVSDVITCSLQLGSLTLRYLRLHKPPKHRLRLERVRQLLTELVPDMRHQLITRKGRTWNVSIEAWKAGFQMVFDAAEADSLTTPLEGNGYLYEVLMRQADRQEADTEARIEKNRQRKPYDGGTTSVGELLSDAQQSDGEAPVRAAVPFVAPPAGPSLFALKVQAQNEALRKAREQGQGGDKP